MKTRLIRNVILVDAKSKHHLLKCDVLLDEQNIVTIWPAGNSLNTEAEIIEGEGMYLSRPWMDAMAHCSEPGAEWIESYESLKASAAAGGFGLVAILPNAGIPRDNASLIKEVLNANDANDVQLLTYGALTKNTEGKQMAEWYDMSSKGAIGFTDGSKPLISTRLMEIGMKYASTFDFTLFFHPEDKELTNHDGVSESTTSLMMGLHGTSPASEILAIQKIITLARYCNAKIHISQISLKESLELISKAKFEGVKITCGTTLQHICFTEKDVANFDVNLKLNLPLRTENDRIALIEGLKNGEIDVLVSNHKSCTSEQKKVEFEDAETGTQSLEAFCGAAFNVLKNHFSAIEFIELLTTRPYQVANWKSSPIVASEKSGFTLFDPNASYRFSESDLKNKWNNCAYLGKDLKGRARFIS